MGERFPDSEGIEIPLYKSIRSRPITPSKVLKVDGWRGRQEKLKSNHDPAESFEICKGKEEDEDGQNYGLQILGCNVPGINERPISAVTRLGGFVDYDDEKLGGQDYLRGKAHRRTDKNGDVIEVTDDFQKLKISRNQIGASGGAGDGPCMFTSEDFIDATSSGITIQSLSSNTVVVVPETHRNLGSRGKLPSSGEELPVHPATAHRSKISKKRRMPKSRIGTINNLRNTSSSQSFHQSVSDETDRFERGPLNKQRMASMFSRQSCDYDEDEVSDCGGSERDYICPKTALSTMFDTRELLRPDTASSEILGDRALAKKEDNKLKILMRILKIHDDDNWYNGTYDDSEESVKDRLLDLTKLFYRREESQGQSGLFYTYKLMLGALHNRLEDYVLLPVPPGFNVKTRITRVKKGVDRRFYPLYYMHLEREGPGDRKCLILVAKKRKCLRGTCYLLSTDPAELSIKSEYCVGLVTSNFIGTEFTLYGGRSICAHIPLDQGALMALPKVERFKEELGTIIYDPNVLGFKGPRKMKIVIPKMKNLLEREEIRPRITEESIISQYRNEETDSIWCLKNKDPIWSNDNHSYILNFAGRVSTPSVKNFQIVSAEDEDQIMLQFGRASENTFSLDFRYPFCPLQAFAIALSSFESKIACE